MVYVEGITIGFVQWLFERIQESVVNGLARFSNSVGGGLGHKINCDLLSEFGVIITVHKSEAKNVLARRLRKFDFNRDVEFSLWLNTSLAQA